MVVEVTKPEPSWLESLVEGENFNSDFYSQKIRADIAFILAFFCETVSGWTADLMLMTSHEWRILKNML